MLFFPMRAFGFKNAIRKVPWPPSMSNKLLERSNSKQLCRTFNNLKVTFLCGFITILVLRGTIGFGNTSENILVDLTNGFSLASLAESRILTEISELEDEQEDEVEGLSEREQFDKGMGLTVTDWDFQRHSWMQENRGSRAPRVFLITGSAPAPCENPTGDHYLLKSLKNKMDYCRIHGIPIFYSLVQIHPRLSGCWSKLPALRTLMLAHPEVEWLWWMDRDAIFTDMGFELPLHKYGRHNLVVYGSENEVYERQSWLGLSTGSFLLRNCQWSLNLLDAWMPMGQSWVAQEAAGKILSQNLLGRPMFEADDQSALIYLLIIQKHVWGMKVYMDNSYYLQGYWFAMVDALNDKNNLRHPFLMHFVGCRACDRYEEDSVEKCLQEMERAFNFGNNQVLAMNGFQHIRLRMSNVARTLNNTLHSSGPTVVY